MSVGGITRVINVTRQVVYSDGSVIVTFNPRLGHFLDGASYQNQRGVLGEALGYTPTWPPVRDTFINFNNRHHFVGWFTEINHLAGNRFTQNTILPDRDITLYAGWTDPRRHDSRWTHSNVIYLNPDIQISIIGDEGEDVWRHAIMTAIDLWNESDAPIKFRFCETDCVKTPPTTANCIEMS